MMQAAHAALTSSVAIDSFRKYVHGCKVRGNGIPSPIDDFSLTHSKYTLQTEMSRITKKKKKKNRLKGVN